MQGTSLVYVEGVNADTIKGIAGAQEDGTSENSVKPLDVLTLGEVTNADARTYRYDDSAYALNEYPFTSVVSFKLPGTDTPNGYVHVGDWEDGYEHVLVVNTSSSNS